jgi:hypothetical protein
MNNLEAWIQVRNSTVAKLNEYLESEIVVEECTTLKDIHPLDLPQLFQFEFTKPIEPIRTNVAVINFISFTYLCSVKIMEDIDLEGLASIGNYIKFKFIQFEYKSRKKYENRVN